jgi:hypothetical protein
MKPTQPDVFLYHDVPRQVEPECRICKYRSNPGDASEANLAGLFGRKTGPNPFARFGARLARLLSFVVLRIGALAQQRLQH